MTSQNANFIVWNNKGEECQRLYFESVDMGTNRYHDIRHTFYHMSKYSFEEDLFIFLGQLNTFYVIPKDKDKSFEAAITGSGYFYGSSLHIINNGTEAWLLGGIYFNSAYNPNNGGSTRFYDFANSRSEIINFK